MDDKQFEAIQREVVLRGRGDQIEQLRGQIDGWKESYRAAIARADEWHRMYAKEREWRIRLHDHLTRSAQMLYRLGRKFDGQDTWCDPELRAQWVELINQIAALSSSSAAPDGGG